MPLKAAGVINMPNAAGSAFDHGAFDPKTRRIFVAHTARDCVEVIDHDAQKHIATLPGFSGVASTSPSSTTAPATPENPGSAAMCFCASWSITSMQSRAV